MSQHCLWQQYNPHRLHSSISISVSYVNNASCLNICACAFAKVQACVGFLCMNAGLSNNKQTRRVSRNRARVCVCLLSVCTVLMKLTYFEMKEDVAP